MPFNGGGVQGRPAAGGGSGAWGAITGTLSAQTDLQSALAALSAADAGGSSPLQLAVVTLSSAQLLAITNLGSAVQLIAAQGANKVIVPTAMAIKYTSGGVAYVHGSGNFALEYRGYSGVLGGLLSPAVLAMTGTVDSFYSEVENFQNGDDLVNFVNVDLVLGTQGNSGAIVTTGNGSLKFHIAYFVMDVS